MNDHPDLIVTRDARVTLRPTGAWTLDNAEAMERLCEGSLPANVATIDIGRVTALDTVGAWLFEKLLRRFSTTPAEVSLSGVSESRAGLMRR